MLASHAAPQQLQAGVGIVRSVRGWLSGRLLGRLLGRLSG